MLPEGYSYTVYDYGTISSGAFIIASERGAAFFNFILHVFSQFGHIRAAKSAPRSWYGINKGLTGHAKHVSTESTHLWQQPQNLRVTREVSSYRSCTKPLRNCIFKIEVFHEVLQCASKETALKQTRNFNKPLIQYITYCFICKTTATKFSFSSWAVFLPAIKSLLLK